MEDTKLMRQQVLSKFFCPIMCDSTQPDNICPFGHWPPVESHLKQLSMLGQSSVDANCTLIKKPLKPLPAYCCASFLAFKCYKREYSFRCGAHSSNDILTRCSDGFHMDWSELDNLKKFGNKMAEVLLGATEICYLESKFVGLVPYHIGIDSLNPLSSSNTTAGHKRPHNVFIKDEEDDDDDELSQVRNLNSTKVDNVVASVNSKANNVAKTKQEQSNIKPTTSAISRIGSRNNDKTGSKLAANRNNRKMALRKKTINVAANNVELNSNQTNEANISPEPILNNDIITANNVAAAKLKRLENSSNYKALDRINDIIRAHLYSEEKHKTNSY